MQTGRIPKSVHPYKLPEGFQSKVVAPRNPKLIKEEKKKDAPVSFFALSSFDSSWPGYGNNPWAVSLVNGVNVG